MPSGQHPDDGVVGVRFFPRANSQVTISQMCNFPQVRVGLLRLRRLPWGPSVSESVI